MNKKEIVLLFKNKHDCKQDVIFVIYYNKRVR